ncbi:hypothetical protein MASR1M101_25110 [Gemmatimonas sp.]
MATIWPAPILGSHLWGMGGDARDVGGPLPSHPECGEALERCTDVVRRNCQLEVPCDPVGHEVRGLPEAGVAPLSHLRFVQGEDASFGRLINRGRVDDGLLGGE